MSIVNFDNSNVLGCQFNIKTGKVWFGFLFGSLSGCGLCKKVQWLYKMNAATLCFTKFMLHWTVSTSVHTYIPQSARFPPPPPIHSCPGWLVCICNTCKSFLPPSFHPPLCTQSSLCVERDRHEVVSLYNSFHLQTDTVTNSGNWCTGLTQRGILTVSLDPRGSCVFCTLCVFSAQCLVHALLHAYTSSLLHLPLHYNVMPSHAPFSSTFLLYPVHLSTSLIACTHLFPRGKFFSLCHCLQHSLPLA